MSRVIVYTLMLGWWAVSMARVVILAVVLEGRSKSEVARDYGVWRQWVQTLVRRYLAEGEAAFEPALAPPHTIPHRIAGEVEDAIVALRKQLAETGHDARAETIAWHLHRTTGAAPLVATIWRVLSRRGFVTPQPHKRPRSSLAPVRRRPAPTNCGRPTSPTGSWPAGGRWRFSTSSTTTPGPRARLETH